MLGDCAGFMVLCFGGWVVLFFTIASVCGLLRVQVCVCWLGGLILIYLVWHLGGFGVFAVFFALVWVVVLLVRGFVVACAGALCVLVRMNGGLGVLLRFWFLDCGLGAVLARVICCPIMVDCGLWCDLIWVLVVWIVVLILRGFVSWLAFWFFAVLYGGVVLGVFWCECGWFWILVVGFCYVLQG